MYSLSKAIIIKAELLSFSLLRTLCERDCFGAGFVFIHQLPASQRADDSFHVTHKAEYNYIQSASIGRWQRENVIATLSSYFACQCWCERRSNENKRKIYGQMDGGSQAEMSDRVCEWGRSREKKLVNEKQSRTLLDESVRCGKGSTHYR